MKGHNYMNTYGPYSPVRQAGDLYFVSGQVGIDPATKQAAKDIEAQTRQTLDNLLRVLEEHSLTADNVVKTTIYLKHMNDFAAVNEIYMTYFNEPRPARATVEVAGLPQLAKHELLVEIEAVVCQP